MNDSGAPRSRGSRGAVILRGLLLYALAPALLLGFLARPAADAVRASASAVFPILLAALAAVGLNWLVYTLVRRRRPTLPVFAWGLFLLMTAVMVCYAALPASERLASTLAVIAGCLALAAMFLLSFWLAARRSKAAHVFAVGLWIAIGVVAVFMLYQVIREIESRRITIDTWITLLILAAMIPAAFSVKIRDSRRENAFRRRASGLVSGKIAQVVGETHLDRDDDLVTDWHVRVRYEVDGVSREIRTPVRKILVRKFGSKAFVGREIPVHYDPDDPGSAYTDRIDRHLFDLKPSDRQEEENDRPPENPGA